MIYQQADFCDLRIVAVTQKNISQKDRFQVKGRVLVKLEGDCDDFMRFLALCRDKGWVLGQRLEITTRPHSHFLVELEFWASCAQRFPEV